MTARWIFASGLLVGSTTGAVLTAAGLSDDPEPALAPAQHIDRVPIEVAGVAGTCEVRYVDLRLTDIACALDAEPTTTEEPADG